MSKGKEIIGTFNAEGKEAIDQIKQKAAELVNLIEAAVENDPRRKALAITHIETGVMFGVKGMFTK